MGTGGNRVGTAWEPGGNQVGARSGGSHWFPLGLHLGVSHAGGSKSEPGWGVGSKRGQTWSPRGPHWPNYVPTWFTRGPHMGPTWCPIGPHMVPTWSPLSPRGPRLVPARVSANRFTARFSHGSRLVPPLGGVVGASDTVILSLARLRLLALCCGHFLERRRHGRRRRVASLCSSAGAPCVDSGRH